MKSTLDRTAAPTIASYPDDLARASLPAAPFRNHFLPRPHTEIEARYFVPASALQNHLELNELPAQRILQAYFPPRLLPEMVRLAADLNEAEDLPNPRFLTHSRVRKVSWLRSPEDCQPAEKEYFLQLKSMKNEKMFRLEVSVPLPEILFNELLPRASDGSLEKIRLVHKGCVFDGNAWPEKAEAHIDFLIAAGKKRAGPPGHAKELFARSALVDVEVPEVSLIAALRDPSRHSFPYLMDGVDLSTRPRQAREALSARSLARHGLQWEPTLKQLSLLLEQSVPFV